MRAVTPAKQVKALGLKSLELVSQMTGQSRAKLRNWHYERPDLFEIICLGCKSKIEGGDDEISKN